MPARNLLRCVLLLLLAGLARGETAWYEDYQAARRLYHGQPSRDQLGMVIGFCQEALRKGVPAGRLEQVQYLLGCAAYDAGNARLAVQALRAAAAADPKAVEARLWLGYAYVLDGRRTLAARTLAGVYDDPVSDPTTKASAAKWLDSLYESPDLRAHEPSAKLVVPGAVVYFHAGEPAVATVRDALAEARQSLRERLGIEVTEPVEVVLFSDAAEYQGYNLARRLPRPEWSSACTVNGRIFTYPNGSTDALRVTILHEYTHVALRAYADDRELPCWLDEGLAVLLSGQFPGYRETIARSPAVLSLKALMVSTFAGYERDAALLAYQQSKAMAEDLLHNQGAMRCRAFLRALGGDQPADAAFEGIFGLTMDAYYAGWVAERTHGR